MPVEVAVEDLLSVRLFTVRRIATTTEGMPEVEMDEAVTADPAGGDAIDDFFKPLDVGRHGWITIAQDRNGWASLAKEFANC